ncbi:BZ3500_MvSof-1268-A1-R1_Chr9g10505 [Microbotryum saponariae]|uniref:BZ3500_MvSof-1268-A1-R1_Chr9g10505 protein n=1 Tax=Microbotryum saponariae TaxID=289078 RepID=A0A2X0L446_9BASI|nr:BZ3501_MvSof-1269-A2-R1_Chr9g10254 [Microbotryum saponariae]SDA00209.1 BZ3500_MvSof-1268-A1-R1_Chr9g10505 [Microbotryum saponariae]
MTLTRQRIDALNLLKQLEHEQELASIRSSSTALQDHLAWTKANTTVKHLRQLLQSLSLAGDEHEYADADADTDTRDLEHRLNLVQKRLASDSKRTSRPSRPIPHLDFLAPSVPLPPPLPSTSIVLPHLSSQDRRASIAISSASIAASPRQAPPAFRDPSPSNPPPQQQHRSPPLPTPASFSPPVPQGLTPPAPASAHRRRSSSIDDYSPDDYSLKKPRSYSGSSERYNGAQDEQPRSYSPYQPHVTEEHRSSYDESSFDTPPISLAPPRGHLSTASFDSPVVPLPRPTIRIQGEDPNEEDEDDESRFEALHHRYPTPPPGEDEDEIDEESGIGAPAPAPAPVKGKKGSAPPLKKPMTSTSPPSSISTASSTVRHRSIIPSMARKKTPAQELGLTSASSITGSSLGASTTSSDLLSHHHDLQSELVNELTSLSSRLKSSTQTFSDNLEKDKEVMETAKDHLEKNADKMSKERGRLTAVKKKTRGTTCWTIGVVAAVAAAWATMFFLIKLT